MGAVYCSLTEREELAITRFHHQSREAGKVLNQVQNVHNDFAQLEQSYQAHSGAVNTGTRPQVQYSYADGSSNAIRITGLTSPNSRNVVDDASAADSMIVLQTICDMSV